MVRELTDRAAVLDVVAAYATALDTRDWVSLRELFTDDAVCALGGSVGSPVGPDAIVEAISSILVPLDATQHLVGNSVVRLHGDDAGHTAYVQAQQVRRGTPGGDLYIVAGRYDDRLRRTADGWRFSYRGLTRMWTDGNRAVRYP